MNRLDRSRPIDDEVSLFDVEFRDATDIASFAERAPLLTGERCCESWHLDRAGGFVCGTNGTALDSLREWAADPRRLIRSFVEFRERGTCTPHWVVVDERPPRWPGDEAQPGEADIEQFMRLRYQLEVVGITLFDAVIFDGADRWWSMCELLTGSTEWGARRFPVVDTGRVRRARSAGAR